MKIAKNKGFLLTEMVVAALIMTIAVMGVINLQYIAFKESLANYESSIALIKSNNLNERLWSNICNLSTSNVNSILSEWRLDNQDLLRDVSYRNTSFNNSSDDILIINVNIEWKSMSYYNDSNEFTNVFIIPKIEC